MPEEWFDVSYINYHKAIMHGFITLERLQHGRCRRREIEQVLTEEQKNKIVDMNEKHEDEMQKLLRSFVSE